MIEKALRIEEESFKIIERSLRGLHPGEFLPIVKRIVHATGDFDYENILRFHPQSVKEGVRAIRAGKDILVDVRMVESGVNRRALQEFGGRVICRINDHDVISLARTNNCTRSETAIEQAVSGTHNIGVVAIGNAPTALLKTMELIESRIFNPALVIGVPVGFVKAEESKDRLSTKPYPFITCLGTKGGSSVAAAIVNALILMSHDVESV